MSLNFSGEGGTLVPELIRPHDRDTDVLRQFAGLLQPHHARLLLAATATILGCLLNLPVPLLVQHLVDEAQAGRSADLPLTAAGLITVLVIQAGCGLLATLTMGRVGLDVMSDLRRRVYDRVLRIEGGASPGVVLSRLIDDVSCIQNIVSAQTVSVLTDVVTAAVIAGWLLWYEPVLAGVVAVFLPVTIWHFRRYTPKVRAGAADVRGRLDCIFADLKEKLDGVLVVKAHGREGAEEALFADRMADAHPFRVRLGRLTTGFTIGGQLISGLGGLAVFAVGVHQVLNGRMTPGGVVSATALTAMLFGPVVRLTDLAALYEQAAASGERLAGLMVSTTRSLIADSPDPVRLSRARGQIEFEGVGFAYTPDRPVLDDLRLQVGPGEHIAVVGPTGCGKSTLLGLLLRFHDPAWGEIRLDGIPLHRLTLADLRRQIGLVPQDPVIFRGSLLDNIRYGCPDADPAQVEAAARVAGVDELARRLPDGYATVIGEGGYCLSQGDRQRVAIARAVCLDPPIVLLDEATSHLDPDSEAAVQAALTGLLRGRTAIIVAHRLNTVRDADRIVVMDGGRVAQVGPHAELIQQPTGLYRRLVEYQFGSSPAA